VSVAERSGGNHDGGGVPSDQTAGMTSTAPLDDGRYDALVVDATPHDDGSCQVELTIVAGAHKGEVVKVRAERLGARSLDLLGIPATLTVTEGVPRVVFEP
jgi:predicted RNA-binding protein with TRAM domain